MSKPNKGAGKGPRIDGFKQGNAWRSGFDNIKGVGIVNPSSARKIKTIYKPNGQNITEIN